jgi:intracellular sulfur oxidation DsrE/DsrF family protein
MVSRADAPSEGTLPATNLFHGQARRMNGSRNGRAGPDSGDIGNWGAKSEVVAVFHTNAGHVMLNDVAYNGERNIKTGNPYRELVADLMNRGVKVELCGATAKAHGWGNEDLLPHIEVNTDAMARTTQLVQQGFIKITEAI